LKCFTTEDDGMQGTMHPTTQCHIPEDWNNKVYILQSIYILVSFQPLYIVDSFLLNKQRLHHNIKDVQFFDDTSYWKGWVNWWCFWHVCGMCPFRILTRTITIQTHAFYGFPHSFGTINEVITTSSHTPSNSQSLIIPSFNSPKKSKLQNDAHCTARAWKLITHRFWGIDDSSIVAKLQHAQHCGKNCIRQEECQSLQRNNIKSVRVRVLQNLSTLTSHPTPLQKCECLLLLVAHIQTWTNISELSQRFGMVDTIFITISF